MKRTKFSSLSFVLLVVFLGGCAKGNQNTTSTKTASIQAPAKMDFGSVKASDLGKIESQAATKIYTPLGSDQIKIHEFASGNAYQVENERVVSRFRAPIDDEVKPAYWRWKFQKEGWSVKKIDSKNSSRRTEQWVSLASGTTVVYDLSVGQITEVIEYASKQ